MRPVDQTVFTVPGGNCFSACLASLLEIPLEGMPQFVDEADDWLSMVDDWLRPRGLYVAWRPLSVECGGEVLSFGRPPPGLHILTGRFPGTPHLHAVVARGDKIVHDPHPARGGIESRRDVFVLAPLDPCYRPVAHASAIACGQS